MIKNFKWQWILLVELFILNDRLWAQKPVIDLGIYGKWPSVELGNGTKITADGNYTSYVVQNQPIGGCTTVIRAIKGNWKVEHAGDLNCQFSQDNHKYIFIRNDSLGIGTLGRSTVSYIPGVSNFALVSKGKNEDWLIYRTEGKTGQLVIRYLQTSEDRKFESVDNYWINDRSQKLILLIKKDDKQQLDLVDLNEPAAKIFWSGRVEKSNINVLWDETGTKIAFVAPNNDSTRGNAIFYYQESADTAVRLADDHSQGIENRFVIDRINSVNSLTLSFTLKKKTDGTENISQKAVSLDVYSYKDAQLQSEQLNQRRPSHGIYMALIDIKGVKVSQISSITTDMRLMANRLIDNQYVLVSKFDDGGEGAGYDEWNWNSHAIKTTYLLSLKNGDLRPVKKKYQAPIDLFYQSPNGKYIIYFDPIAGNYFSYSVATGRTKNITRNIQTNWSKFDPNDDDEIIAKYAPVGVAGYLQDGQNVLLYDRRDIYQIDMSGIRTPLCLTNYVGRKQNIEFRLTFYNYGYNPGIIPNEKELIVNAFNRTTKNDGFSTIRLGLQKSPQSLSTQDALVDGIEEYEVGGVQLPIKARDAKVYVVKRQKATEAPNLFYTSDFKTFNCLTDIAPQKSYNWLTSELISWKTFNRTMSQGILYKPENFDPKKKYPIIFFYYERFSNSLHRFLLPEANGACIDIPTYLSNGYLVFVPDIHYPPGTGQGPGCYNTVVSAAKYLSQFPWVDSKHMGINGHSRGGFETDYLITHTPIFAAAISGSGYSDAVSLYSRFRTGGGNAQGSYEFTHQRIGATLWQKQDLYLENSPVLKADKVNTPVLMMNNLKDRDIPFEQGAEFFNALRRLGKKAWMLQYDGEGHVLANKNAANDLAVRMRQFFDYYLKNAQPPIWMTRGIPAKLKGIEVGLELDTSGATP